ncbi:MAG: type IV pilin N-terminal domain-containing protein [Methanomicrobiales archaeon]|nr:type IV pilin N-terminal domain-containing protein [Methanomicrobiales archaeon]
MKRDDGAVSPVVGVMLMLVVTIIIAAVVSGFAGGLAGGTKAVPQAAIAVKIDTAADDGMGGTTTKMTFTLLSGDPIPTRDLEIVTYYTNASGYTYKHTQSASSDMVDLYGLGTANARMPYLNDARYGYAGDNPAVDFGNYTWKTGDVLSTGNVPGTATLLGIGFTRGTWPDPDTFDDPDFGPGSIVEVKILHVPSGKFIFDREVAVL